MFSFSPLYFIKKKKKKIGSSASWGRGGRGRGGRGRGGGGGTSLLAAPALQASQYPAGLPMIEPGLREVVNILGQRNRAGRILGIGPPPGAIEETANDEEEGEAELKRPPKPLLRRIISYLRDAWTGVKFALGKPDSFF